HQCDAYSTELRTFHGDSSCMHARNGEGYRRIRRASERSRTHRLQAVDVLVQVRGDALPHRVEDEVDAFAARQLRGGDEIRVAGHQHDLVHQVLVGQRGDVDADLHVYLGLAHVRLVVLVAQVVPFQAAVAQLLHGLVLELPLAALGEPT